MGDSLKERLSSHSDAFEGLLSLIPARYYYEDENNSQWKKKSRQKDDDQKAEARKHKDAKFDPDVGSSALDEIKRRENRAVADKDGAGAADVYENVVIYDDQGNQVGGEIEESVEELLRSKARSDSKPALAIEKTDADASNAVKAASVKSPAPAGKVPKVDKVDINAEDERNTEEGSASSDTGNDDAQDLVNAEHEAINEQAAEPKANGAKREKLSKSGIEELRAKLAAKVSELRARRKAPGSNVSGAPKSREELLAARKQRLEQKQNLKRGREEVESDSSSESELDDGDVDESQTADDDSVMFGKVEFGDGARLGRDARSIEGMRKTKKRNAIDQLRWLENRKQKLANLDESRQKDIGENAKWSRAILQAEGSKVRDDERLLRKTVKNKQNRKRKSEKEWRQRLDNVDKGISSRQAKRDANIEAHKDAKKMRLKGKKRRMHMKKASAAFKQG